MSITSAAPPSLADESAPRVRHQARDAAALMAFSAGVSLGCALFLLMLAVLARQA
jgi:hypothetical protein